MLKPMFHHLMQESAPTQSVVGMIPHQIEAPEFSLTDMISEVMAYCAMKRQNPVRYLSLEGEDEKVFVPGYWRPNILRGCQAKQAYKIHKVPGIEPPFNLQKQFTFDRGNVFEAWLIAYLHAAQAAGIFGVSNIRRNLVVYDKQTGVGGKYDVIFTRNGFDYLIECKSKESSKAFKSINVAAEDHRAQHNDYMAITGIHAGFVVYFGIEIGVEDPETAKVDKDKTAIKIRSFFHRFSPKLWQETIHRCGMMEWFRDDPSILPPKSTKPFFECKECIYKGVCDMSLSPVAAIAALKFQGK